MIETEGPRPGEDSLRGTASAKVLRCAGPWCFGEAVPMAGAGEGDAPAQESHDQ